jgi:hypothetical protein
MMIDDLQVWTAAWRGGHGMISGLDFVEFLRDSIQRDAIIVAENHMAPDARPRLPQAVSQLANARLNFVSELVGAHPQPCKSCFFVPHGPFAGFRHRCSFDVASECGPVWSSSLLCQGLIKFDWRIIEIML